MKRLEPLHSQSNYIPQLDGIRGFAILLVLTFHYFGFIKIFSFGWVGVDLFFVLSGYLITSRLHATKSEKDYFSRFYLNRALRILPVYYLSLLFFYAALNLLLSAENLPSFNYYNKYLWSFIFFFQNWTFIKEMPGQDHLLHFWTLAVEEQFYLLWPAFIFIFLDKRYFYKLCLLLILAIITVRCIIYINHPGTHEYQLYLFNTFCRMDSFIIGACLFPLQQKINLKRVQNFYLIVLAIIILGITLTNTAQSNYFISTIGYTLLAIFFAGLINFIIINPNSILSEFFKIRWLKFLGKISYGLYIYHWIIYRVLHPKINYLLRDSFINSELRNYVSLFSCVIVSLVISTISYYFFESYFLRLKKSIPPKQPV